MRVRMKSYAYLSEWQKLLSKLGIGSKVYNNQKLYCLIIEGAQDFFKLNELGFDLKNKRKSMKWDVVLKSYKRRQISRNSAQKTYLKKLREINFPITAKQFSEKINKNKRTVNHYLKILTEKRLIKVDKSKIDYYYFI